MTWQALHSAWRVLVAAGEQNEFVQVLHPMNVNSCKLKIDKYFLEIEAHPYLLDHVSDHKGNKPTYLRLRIHSSVLPSQL